MTGSDNTFIFITPMFNASKTLDQCLASLVGQSYKNWKIILIDDVSSDAEIMKESEIISRWRPMCHSG